jgi:hypothetical protein
VGKRRIHRSKSREEVVREVPVVEVLAKEEEGELGMEEVVLATGHLQEYECTALKKNKGNRSKSRKEQEAGSDLEGPQEEGSSSAGLQTELLTAVRTDNIKLLEQVAARLSEGGEARERGREGRGVERGRGEGGEGWRGERGGEERRVRGVETVEGHFFSSYSPLVFRRRRPGCVQQ